MCAYALVCACMYSQVNICACVSMHMCARAREYVRVRASSMCVCGTIRVCMRARVYASVCLSVRGCEDSRAIFDVSDAGTIVGRSKLLLFTHIAMCVCVHVRT